MLTLGHARVNSLDGVLHILDDELAAGGLAHLERRLPHRVVSDLIANAEDAVRAKALDPRDCDLAMKQTMVNAK